MQRTNIQSFYIDDLFSLDNYLKISNFNQYLKDPENTYVDPDGTIHRTSSIYQSCEQTLSKLWLSSPEQTRSNAFNQVYNALQEMNSTLIARSIGLKETPAILINQLTLLQKQVEQERSTKEQRKLLEQIERVLWTIYSATDNPSQLETLKENLSHCIERDLKLQMNPGTLGCTLLGIVDAILGPNKKGKAQAKRLVDAFSDCVKTAFSQRKQNSQSHTSLDLYVTIATNKFTSSESQSLSVRH